MIVISTNCEERGMLADRFAKGGSRQKVPLERLLTHHVSMPVAKRNIVTRIFHFQMILFEIAIRNDCAHELSTSGVISGQGSNIKISISYGLGSFFQSSGKLIPG